METSTFMTTNSTLILDHTFIYVSVHLGFPLKLYSLFGFFVRGNLGKINSTASIFGLLGYFHNRG